MRKSVFILSAAIACSLTASAQSAMDGYQLSKPDMNGTARFMGMAGAFGALGGDMTTLSYNPAGIGVYRSSEIGATVNFDIQNSSMETGLYKTTNDNFKFLLNNAGYIGTVRLPSSVMPNFNWGFTYNRRANFNRRYSGGGAVPNSMSNYMAGVANQNELTVGDLTTTGSYDPYYPTDGGYAAPWIDILGYDSYLISHTGENENGQWHGLYGDGTSGAYGVTTQEQGGIDDYNIAFGGNFANFLYWGMNFDITNLDYTRQSMYGEDLKDAYVMENADKGFQRSNASWDLYNFYNVEGTGFNYKLGIIVRPINELRLGFAFHTPTWYNLTESYLANTTYSYPGTDIRNGGADTNSGYMAESSYHFRTPWRFIASAAGVIADKMIISMDVDWTDMQYIHFSSPYYEAPSFQVGLPENDPFFNTNQNVKQYYKTSVTFRAGVEYRVLPNFSVRAGYAHTSTPVRELAKNNQMTIASAGTEPSYTFDNTTDYVTLGLGYRYKAFYTDLAYVYRHETSAWHAFTPDPQYPENNGAQADLAFNRNQIVWSMGFKF